MSLNYSRASTYAIKINYFVNRLSRHTGLEHKGIKAFLHHTRSVDVFCVISVQPGTGQFIETDVDDSLRSFDQSRQL